MTKRPLPVSRAFLLGKPVFLPALTFVLGIATALAGVWLIDDRAPVMPGSGIVLLKPVPAARADLRARADHQASWQSVFDVSAPQFSKTAVLLEGVNGETVAVGADAGLAKAVNDASPETVSTITVPRDLKVGDVLNLRFGNGAVLTFRVMARKAAECASIDASIHPVPDVTLVKCDQAERSDMGFWHYTVEAVDEAAPRHQAVQHSL